MLIDKGRIELERHGVGVRFIHRGENGEPIRILQRQSFQTAVTWQRAVEDWLANFHEDMPLRRTDGTLITVGAYEAARA